MKIIELKSSNIKRLKAVELTLDENQNLIVVSGRNAQGKSSILDSIWYALGGKKALPDMPIREGEERGEIELNLDGYIVSRTFTDKGAYLSVTNKDGSKYSNPQEFLDFIVGNLSFDPLEFARLDAKKQVAELSKIVGLDFTELDEKKKNLTQERVLVHRELTGLKKLTPEQLAKLEEEALQPAVSVAELSQTLQEANQMHNTYLAAQQAIVQKQDAIAKWREEIQALEAKIAEEEQRLELAKQVTDTTVNIEEVTKQIASAEDVNAKIREAKAALNEYAKRQEKEGEWLTLDEQIKSIEEAKRTKLAEAKMPIDGLSWDWDEGIVTFNNIPYDQISSAEQLKVSMAIAMAANPKLRVIIIKDGSLLDQDNLRVIEEMARDADFQVWLEAVDDTGKMGIYIEDGEVKAIN